MERVRKKAIEIQKKLANAHDQECEGSSAYGVYVNKEEAELYLEVKKCMRVVELKRDMTPEYIECTEQEWAMKLANIWLVCMDWKLKSSLTNVDPHQLHEEEEEEEFCPICYETWTYEPVREEGEDSELDYRDHNVEILCFGDTLPDDEFEIGTGVKAMPCSHKFHGICLKRWLERSDYKNCPVCRQPPVQDHQDIWANYSASVRRSLEMSFNYYRLKEACWAGTLG